eukprot:scaffold112705_cov62-Attheya_sp.AAC.6
MRAISSGLAAVHQSSSGTPRSFIRGMAVVRNRQTISHEMLSMVADKRSDEEREHHLKKRLSIGRDCEKDDQQNILVIRNYGYERDIDGMQRM